MPLSSLDIVFYYTGAGSTIANTLSLGGTISTNTIPDNVPNNIFDDVTGDESTSGAVEYRAIACKDINPTYDMLNTKVWITGYSRAASSYDVIKFALENPGGSPSSIQAIASETVAPDANKFTIKTGATVSWTEEGAPSNTLFFGTVNAGQWFGIWLMRSVPANAAAYTNRSVTLRVQCETTASPFRTVIDKEYVITFGSSGKMTIYENKGAAVPVV